MFSTAKKMAIVGAASGLVANAAICFSTGALPVAQISKKYQDLHLADFIPTKGQIEIHNLSPELASAAPKLTILDQKGQPLEDCTGTVISNTGIVLTAGHCLNRCKIKNFSIDRDMHVQVDNSEHLKTTCQIEVNGVRMPLDVIDTDGCPRYRPSIGGKPYDCPFLDWAVIQIDQSKIGQLPCLDVESSPPTLGTPVIDIGYPSRTIRAYERAAAQDSKGTGQYVSYGSIIPYQNYCTSELDDKDDPYNGRISFDKQDQLGSLENAVMSGLLYQTDVDVVAGSSGGPLLSASTKRLVGMASFVTSNTNTFECRGSTFFESINSIKRAFKLLNPASNMDALFHCPVH